jgi:beta-galactosidase
MYFGVAYYPEHWPEERWEVDAQLMRAAGINGVRMGEFAWSKIEPREGEYHFDWLDRAIALLRKYGSNHAVHLFTHPPWVFPKIEIEIRGWTGARRTAAIHTVCLIIHFVELSQRIDQVVIEHFARNDALPGISTMKSARNCYCETAIKNSSPTCEKNMAASKT